MDSNTTVEHCFRKGSTIESFNGGVLEFGLPSWAVTVVCIHTHICMGKRTWTRLKRVITQFIVYNKHDFTVTGIKLRNHLCTYKPSFAQDNIVNNVLCKELHVE